MQKAAAPLAPGPEREKLAFPVCVLDTRLATQELAWGTGITKPFSIRGNGGACFRSTGGMGRI